MLDPVISSNQIFQHVSTHLLFKNPEQVTLWALQSKREFAARPGTSNNLGIDIPSSAEKSFPLFLTYQAINNEKKIERDDISDLLSKNPIKRIVLDEEIISH